MEQVEVARRRLADGQAVGVGQAGGAVLGGEAGDVPGGAHRLLDRGGREVGAARVAAPLTGIDGDADRLVAVALDVLGLALAHRDREAHAFRNLGDRIARAERLGRRQRAVDQLAETFARIGEVGRRERPGGRRHLGSRVARRAEGSGQEAAAMITTPFPAPLAACEPAPNSPKPTRRRRRRRAPCTGATPEQDPAQGGFARAAVARRGAGRAVRRAARRPRPARAAARRAAGLPPHPQPRSAAPADAADRQAHARRRRRRRPPRRRRAPARPGPGFAGPAPGGALARRADRRRRGGDALRQRPSRHRHAAPAHAWSATRARMRRLRPSSAAAAPFASCSSSCARTRGTDA